MKNIISLLVKYNYNEKKKEKSWNIKMKNLNDNSGETGQ